MIVFEPTTWSDEKAASKWGPKITKPTFTQVPGGPSFINRSGYAFHYYSWVNKPDQQDYFIARQQDLKTLGQPVQMVTEWNLGGCQNPEADCDCTEMDIFDKFKVSVWMAWDYKSFLPPPDEMPFVSTCTGCGGGLLPNAVNGYYNVSWASAHALARAYPIAIQGRLQGSFAFNWTQNELKFDYVMDPSVDAPTLVYLNTRLDDTETGGANPQNVNPRYPGGKVQVIITPATAAQWAWVPARNGTVAPDTIEITAKAGATKVPVSVVITPQ